MNTREFKKGSTGWMLINDSRRSQYDKNTQNGMSELDIVSVGRKYVHTSDGRKFKTCNYCDEFLDEEISYGQSNYLFPSKEALESYVIHVKLLSLFQQTLSKTHIRNTTISQLQLILVLLDDPDFLNRLNLSKEQIDELSLRCRQLLTNAE